MLSKKHFKQKFSLKTVSSLFFLTTQQSLTGYQKSSVYQKDIVTYSKSAFFFKSLTNHKNVILFQDPFFVYKTQNYFSFEWGVNFLGRLPEAEGIIMSLNYFTSPLAYHNFITNISFLHHIATKHNST